MSTTKPSGVTAKKAQEVCIDLPGESVQCWRSSDNIKVILRKHRDVIFDINLQPGTVYTVESKGEFYNPVQKKLANKVEFLDGDICHLWVSREFKSELLLKANGRDIGAYRVNHLDVTDYGGSPKTKPEPLMVVMGQKSTPVSFMCTPDDRFGAGSAQSEIMPPFEPKLSIMKDLGTKFDYTFLHHAVEVKEYVAITEASANEIQPGILTQLDSNVAAEGSVDQIFIPPKKEQSSLLYLALFTAARNISGSEFLTGNAFKETTGYMAENFRALNRMMMKVHIEKKVKGKYRVALKGFLVSDVYGKLTGAIKTLKPQHINVALGTKEAAFIDGGFGKTGKAGYGGFKRILMTSTQNFGNGLKIQGVGTVIDLIVDANTVYFDEKGSKDLSEFLGRAGVSLAKAGATAALGSAIAAFGTVLLTGAVGATLPVWLLVALVVGGFMIAAALIDDVDNGLGLKNKVANWAR